MTLIHHTKEQWDDLEKEFWKMRRDNAVLRVENKKLSGKNLALESKVFRLKAEVEALRSEYELPASNPTLEEIRSLFPRLPFIQNKLREVFLVLWRHRESLLSGDPSAPEYLNAFAIHKALYGGLKAPTKSRSIHVQIHHLRRELQHTLLRVEGFHGKGWRLKLYTQPVVAETK
jgi:hypothetical protein